MPNSPRVPAQLIEAFAAITGPANALTDQADTAPYTQEWRGLWHGQTPLVLRPRTTAEVAAILALANLTGTPIIPQSGNTGLVGAQVPDGSGREVILSLARMTSLRAIDAGGYTLTAEAGVTLKAVQDAAELHDRLFPLSLASEGSCRIGGNLSTNAGGIAVLAYGNARDMVLGLEVVLADGRIWNGLRALRKDNTGYDLKHLFIGGEGTLGIITAAVLKLFPRPREKATAFVGLASPEKALDFFQRVRSVSGPGLTAFELLPRLAIDFVLRHHAKYRDPLAERHAWYVLMDLSGPSADGAMRALAERELMAALEAGLIDDVVIAESLSQSRTFWAMREDLSETQKPEGGSIKHDVSVPIASLPDLIARGNAGLAKLMPGIRSLPFGHFGDGNLHFNVSQPEGMEKAAFLARTGDISAVIYDLVIEMGGSISAEHGIGRLKREQLVSVKSAVELGMMRTIKAAFDPNNILSPGRVL